MHHIFFIHSSVGGQLGWLFHSVGVVNNAAVNVGVHLPLGHTTLFPFLAFEAVPYLFTIQPETTTSSSSPASASGVVISRAHHRTVIDVGCCQWILKLVFLPLPSPPLSPLLLPSLPLSQNTVLLCSLGWPQTQRDLLAFTSQVLGDTNVSLCTAVNEIKHFLVSPYISINFT